MALSKHIGAYGDVKQVLDAALAVGGAVYELPSASEATRWRARAYKFRALAMDLSAAEVAEFPGVAPSTPYDHMHLVIEPKSNVITIKFERPLGLLRKLDGSPIDLKQVKRTDELVDAANAFAATLTGEDMQ